MRGEKERSWRKKFQNSFTFVAYYEVYSFDLKERRIV